AAALSTSEATSARTGPIISPPPVTPPTPPGDSLPAFKCADFSGGNPNKTHLTAVRVAPQGGFDRFVLQSGSPVPVSSVTRQAKPVFTHSPSGQPVTLSGTAGVSVVVHSTTGNNTYAGPTDFTQADFPVLKEARQIEDFEGTLIWGLGLG